jgi:hypothetical protein
MGVDSKATRRTALGIIAGGLAATSSVLYAVRKRTRIPMGAFDKEWRECLGETEVTIQDAQGPGALDVPSTPPLGSSARFVSLFAAYDRNRGSADAPKTFRLTKGDFVVQSIEDGKIKVSGKNSVDRMVAPISSRDKPTGEWVLHLPGPRPSVQQSETIVAPPALLAVPFSKGIDYGTGASWKGPTTFLFVDNAPESTYSIVGYASVAGTDTVKVQLATAVSRLSSTSGSTLKHKEKVLLERGYSKQDAARIAAELTRARVKMNAEATTEAQGLAYVDVRTGLTVRLELALTVTHEKAGSTAEIVYQTFPA